MAAVVYRYRLPYVVEDAQSFPGLNLALRNPADPSRFAYAQAVVDSGAEYSLFDGQIASAIGLDLLAGKRFGFETISGSPIESRIHPVILVHGELGEFKLDLRFSTGTIARNILGRDFFNLAQIGFRERQSLLMITPEP
ncbi:MAG: hypothetical protein ACREQI_02395 [Candidatus Binataceae bacterium]